MLAINHLEYWLLFVLSWAVVVLMVWAFADCASRKAPAFPAAGKLTKPAWMVITGISALVGILLALNGVGAALNILFYVGTTACAVYLADVRPAVREISGPSRW
ncbi:DUF2516 family protein [Jatrophihabitans telluris]|uniref:DUF2516 family protein n=1 Tax=Jatrophihabitans telluris TaxID=2038343 RepID=A0ABY4R018_9ACTN|nr:DUF2516 family protein [Jatrophihabitans telluris]UQX88792.1 DUF2516 family protein [Jatrophihabitans telluris]